MISFLCGVGTGRPFGRLDRADLGAALLSEVAAVDDSSFGDAGGLVTRSIAGIREICVRLRAYAAHLVLEDPAASTEGIDQVVDLMGRNRAHEGLRHDCTQGPGYVASTLEQTWEERALGPFGAGQLDIADWRKPLGSVPIALGGAEVAAFRLHRQGCLRLDELLKDPLDAAADGVGRLAGLEHDEQVGQVWVYEGRLRDCSGE